jgi:dihydroneopterin aldolase/D-erythro-7,8-dihydroneopterin triphosphate epimerase
MSPAVSNSTLEASVSDTVFIRDLDIRMYLGINEIEQVVPQDVRFNIQMQVDTTAAAASDDISDAVDYKAVTKSIIALVTATRFQLVERLADEVARHCLEEGRVNEVTVTIEKPGALRFARSVGVTIHRTK